MSDLELVFEPGSGEPFLQTKGISARKKGRFGSKTVAVSGKWYRVGLVNHRPMAIENVSVSVVTAGGLTGLPLRLAVKDQRDGATGILLNPSGSLPTAFVDVLFAGDGATDVQILHAISGVGNSVPLHDFDLLLEGRGADIEPVQLKLSFSEKDGSLSVAEEKVPAGDTTVPAQPRA
jgi:hypothetical protein